MTAERSSPPELVIDNQNRSVLRRLVGYAVGTLSCLGAVWFFLITWASGLVISMAATAVLAVASVVVGRSIANSPSVRRPMITGGIARTVMASIDLVDRLGELAALILPAIRSLSRRELTW